MNDIENAIEVLKNEIKTSFSIFDALPEKSRDRATDLTNKIKTYGIAISALEKQEAKKPKFENNGGYPEYFEHWLACPICDEAIPEYTAENNTWCYCLGCGQKLDWSEVQE